MSILERFSSDAAQRRRGAEAAAWQPASLERCRIRGDLIPGPDLVSGQGLREPNAQDQRSSRQSSREEAVRPSDRAPHPSGEAGTSLFRGSLASRREPELAGGSALTPALRSRTPKMDCFAAMRGAQEGGERRAGDGQPRRPTMFPLLTQEVDMATPSRRSLPAVRAGIYTRISSDPAGQRAGVERPRTRSDGSSLDGEDATKVLLSARVAGLREHGDRSEGPRRFVACGLGGSDRPPDLESRPFRAPEPRAAHDRRHADEVPADGADLLSPVSGGRMQARPRDVNDHTKRYVCGPPAEPPARHRGPARGRPGRRTGARAADDS